MGRDPTLEEEEILSTRGIEFGQELHKIVYDKQWGLACKW